MLMCGEEGAKPCEFIDWAATLCAHHENSDREITALGCKNTACSVRDVDSPVLAIAASCRRSAHHGLRLAFRQAIRERVQSLLISRIVTSLPTETWMERINEKSSTRWNAASAIVDPEGRGPRLYFQRVPEPKVVKNRVHLDLNVGGGRQVPLEERRVRIDAAVDRLRALGAAPLRPVEERGEYWVVMTDPEGNEFCLQ
jgi:hypothetical protein